jgi:site-specific DNA recombinase
MDKIKTIGYIRVSREIQVEDGSSLESQRDYLKKYCELNNLELVDIISDEGISAFKTKTSRPGFKNVMNLIKQKEIGAVVTYSISRFARNTATLLSAVELMKANDVQFHSVKEKLDTGSAMGIFFLTIIGAIAQLESGTTSERIKDVKKSNKEAKRVYSSPVYGFQNDAVSHTLVPIESEQKLIQRIYSMKETMSYHKIAKILNEEGVPTKNPGSKWHNSTIQVICKNPIHK